MTLAVTAPADLSDTDAVRSNVGGQEAERTPADNDTVTEQRASSGSIKVKLNVVSRTPTALCSPAFSF